MAIQRIPGNMLESNLVRTSDLTFNTDLFVLDVTNERIGIKTTPGAYALDVNGSARFQNDVEVDGNLTVNGTTTTLDSQTLVIEDPIIELAKNNSGGDANTFDQGLFFNRGSLDNVSFLWDESADQFAFATTSSEDGTTQGDVSIDSYADIRFNNANANKVSLDGLDIEDNTITGTRSNENIVINPAGTGVVEVTGSITTTGATVNGDVTATNITVSGDLTVQGTTTTIDSQNLVVEDNLLFINSNNSAETDAGIMINRGSADSAVMYFDENDDVFRVGTTPDDGSTRTDLTNVTLVRMQGATPTQNDDFATKNYVDSNAGGAGALGTPDGFSDSNSQSVATSFPDGAYPEIGSADNLTEAIAALNETMENIRETTYVQSVDFTADQTVGGAGLVVTLTITHVGGGADRFTIDWGDGNTDTAITDSTPSHTYNTNVGSPFDVTVRAFANGAVTNSAGSFATKTRENYITIFTATPIVGFDMYAASSGGSAITHSDSGSTVYLENTTTNTGGATVTYSVDWGDGNTETIASDSADGGVSGSRLAHTYTNSASDDGSTVAGTGAGDTRYSIRLVLESHSTATPAEIPRGASSNFDVYTTHTPKIDIADSTVRGVNEESTSGFPVTFINGTDTNPGAHSTFSSNVYQWDFTDDSTQTSVNVGSGSSGDTGQTIAKTFGFTQTGSGTQGTTTTYPVTLNVSNLHTSSPFTSAITNIVVEPDVRANIAGTAATVSTGSSDNSLTLYDHTDLSGNNRALATFTNTSQNADDYEYDFQSDSSDVLTVTEDGATAGSIGATLDKNFTGVSTGSFSTAFRAVGTPDTIHQSDSETVTFTMKAVPSAPANLSTKSLTLSDSAQFTNTPKLTAGATDNTGSFTSLTAGDSLNTTTVRRYTSGTIDTSTVSNAFNGASGTLSASINTSADGTKAFSTSLNETGTFTSLVVSSNVDYQDVDATYPQDFYQVFSAKIAKALTNYSVGVNAQRLEHTATGDTNLVYVVRDDITASPTTTIGTVAQGTAGTYHYTSGIPYYDSGSPTITITGTTIANLTGIAYADVSDPHEIDPGTLTEGSGNVIANTSKTYANIDGASSFLTGGIPNMDTGVASAYTIGAQTVNITTSSIFAVQTIKARSKNVNGTSAYNEDSTKIQVFTATPGGLNKDQDGIIVSDSLGATHDDDAVRITGLGSAADNPAFNSATNYYTSNAWSGNVTVAGTQEAIVRPTSTSAGTIQHDITDYSTGYLPAGPDRSSDTGAQYYTFAFRRSNMANFTVTMTGTVSGFFIAAPGTDIDDASGLNGWLDASIAYAGSGVPGSDTGNGGNGSNGCAFTSGDRIVDGTSYSNQAFTLTLGSENGSNATGNNILVRIKLESGDSVTALSIA